MKPQSLVSICRHYIGVDLASLSASASVPLSGVVMWSPTVGVYHHHTALRNTKG